MKGRIFNIQRFSIHDGPGIRTSVFVKGCNLRCLWCHNPESNSFKQEIQYFPQKCQMCGNCIETCTEGAHYIDLTGEKIYDRSKCKVCGKCTETCFNDALVLVAKYMQPEEVVEIVLKDLDYYKNSGGGLTISGGEPLLQKEFVRGVFERTKALGIHNALDTAAHVPWSDIEYVLPFVDLVLLDIKAMHPETHKRGTGVSNERILQNAARLAQQEVEMIVRIPVIPGINATMENMNETAAFLKGFPRLKYVELLPYHDLGVDKYTSLGKTNGRAIFDIPSDEEMRALAGCFHEQNIPINME